MSEYASDDGKVANLEVQCTFRTNLPEQYKVAEDLEIQMQTSSGPNELSQILKQMMEDDGCDLPEMKTRKLQFMVNDKFITTTLQELMDRQSLSSETVVEIWYSFALDKPKQKVSIPQDEWISTLRSLSHQRNEKARTYVAAFFNGDLKVLDGKDKTHQEMIVVQKLHQDQINDVLYYKSDENAGRKFVISCSEQPFPEMKVSEVVDGNSLKVLAQVPEQIADGVNGWNCLSQNPLTPDVFASCSSQFKRTEENKYASIQLWKITEESLNNFSVQTSNKRQKTEISSFEPTQHIQINGANVITWLDSDTLVAGCQDHAIKLVDLEKTFLIKQSIMTDFKLPTCIDSSSHLILAGCEDSILRLYDTRSGSKSAGQYEAHDRYITGVKFNSMVDNVFISSSIDGTVRLWDLRNTDVPLANLKHKTADACEDFKIFGLEWNGASQILSGGSDSHISVHSM